MATVCGGEREESMHISERVYEEMLMDLEMAGWGVCLKDIL